MAEVTNPTIYYHFGSKEGLFLAVLEDAFARHTQRVGAALEGIEDDRERLVAFVEASIAMAHENPDLGRLLFVSQAPCPPVRGTRELFTQKVNETRALVSSILGGIAGETERAAGTVDFAAFALLSLLNGMIHQLVFHETEVEHPRTMADRIVTLILRGAGFTATERDDE
jgi:AcrR family transcriptional regulator